MSRNSFKHIEELQNERYPGAPPRIEKEIEHNLGIGRSMGNVLDMYFPKVIKIFLMILGGKGDHIESTNDDNRTFDNPINRGSSASSILPTDDPPPSGPSSPD